MSEKSTLYKTIKRMIERGQTKDLQKKMDVFCTVGSLSLDDYSELVEMLNAQR